MVQYDDINHPRISDGLNVKRVIIYQDKIVIGNDKPGGVHHSSIL